MKIRISHSADEGFPAAYVITSGGAPIFCETFEEAQRAAESRLRQMSERDPSLQGIPIFRYHCDLVLDPQDAP